MVIEKMGRDAPNGSSKLRPAVLSSKSFTRFEPAPSTTSIQRNRASTLQTTLPVRSSLDHDGDDIFTQTDHDSDMPESPALNRTNSLPEKFDELPIELASLTDRFVDSLSTKSYDQPPSIDHISDLFQEFYIKAASNISIHISALISRLNNDASPTPSTATAKSTSMSRNGSHDSLSRRKAEAAQQMLTASEVTERRKARKLLEHKRLVLEEAVEKRACEKIYSKLWRHKSTLDEVRDEKLRSKTAALALVGINLKDLGIELGSRDGHTVEDIQQLLLPARDGLMRMNEERCPLGKLQHLTKAHKAIVDTLYAIHGSSSSADEILPTLIFTLITSPIEGINIISNLNFIQRFRTASKIDGEAAYCLTNLEAAISFLENVDLSTLRADELPEGPRKTPSQPGTPITDRHEPFPVLPATSPPSEAIVVESTASVVAEIPSQPKTAASIIKSTSTPRHQRTLSDIFQPVQASSEAVRIKANEGIENIANTLDNSFKFLFGKLKEQAADPKSPNEVVVPKTLDEARQLVSRPTGPDEDGAVISETSSIAERDVPESTGAEKGKAEDKLLSLFGGRKTAPSRERSVDSSKSGTSSRRVTFTQSGATAEGHGAPKDTVTSVSATSKPLESVKNLGSSLNPFNSIGSAFGGGFRGFGRPSMPAPATVSSPVALDSKKDEALEAATRPERDLQVTVDAASQVAAKIRAVPPPVKKFIMAESAQDLRIKDVNELLEDYKRLAGLLTELASYTGKENVSKKV